LIFLVRHGETEWNLAQRMQGQMDSPLTPLGLDQARHNAELLRSLIGDLRGFKLISSPLGRARRSAEIIGEALSITPDFDPRLVEIALGEWDGLTVDQINQRRAGTWDRTRLDGSLFGAPGGETFESMYERLSACLVELKPPAIVVSHGVTIRFLRGLFLKLDRDGIFGLQPSRQDGVFRLLNGQVDFLEPAPAAT
jgi:broad specificity phosphatase PhoE